MSEYKFTKSKKGEARFQEVRRLVLKNARTGKRCPTFTYTYRYNLQRVVDIFNSDQDVKDWIEATYENEIRKLSDPSVPILYNNREGWTTYKDKGTVAAVRRWRARERRRTQNKTEKEIWETSCLKSKMARLHPRAYKARAEHARRTGGDWGIWFG